MLALQRDTFEETPASKSLFVPVPGTMYRLKSLAHQCIAGDVGLADAEEVRSTDDCNDTATGWYIDPHPTNEHYQIMLATGGSENMLYIKERDGVHQLELTRDRFVGRNTYWKVDHVSVASAPFYHVTAIDYKDETHSRIFAGPHNRIGVHPAPYTSTWETFGIVSSTS